jgi:hypothetical protein
LAALGALRILDHRARLESRAPPRLSWVDEGCWRPVVHGVLSVEAIVSLIVEDKVSWHRDPAFVLAYDDSGMNLVDPSTAPGKVSRDLKPKPEAMRAFLEGIAQRAALEQSRQERIALGRALETAASYGSELIQDNNGNTKPTGFHFTAGQQQFMKAVAELQEKVSEADLFEALVGPWRRESLLPNMGWDATNARLYALRASNPSGDKKTTVAGADWLAFVGLGAFPSFPANGRLNTTGIQGGWKDSAFTWAVWERPATWRTARSLCRNPKLAGLSESERRARGLAAAFTASIARSDQGGYGSFAPATVG